MDLSNLFPTRADYAPTPKNNKSVEENLAILGITEKIITREVIARAYRRKIAPYMITPGHYPRELLEQHEAEIDHLTRAMNSLLDN